MTSGGELAHAKLIQGICIWLGFIFLLREMLRFLVYICSLNLVLTYLTPSAVGLAWDATGGWVVGDGGVGDTGRTGQPPHDLMNVS